VIAALAITFIVSVLKLIRFIVLLAVTQLHARLEEAEAKLLAELLERQRDEQTIHQWEEWGASVDPDFAVQLFERHEQEQALETQQQQQLQEQQQQLQLQQQQLQLQEQQHQQQQYTL